MPVPRPGRPAAYRIDRVRGVEVLDDAFSPPAGLDPVAMLEEHLAVEIREAARVPGRRLLGAGEHP
ncbi:hypothetical protein [Nonomuraea polychroma]|uniref:hypothetical protein n=1 Tax=Nonomuraea polychroma TaxID=46176 RepID=UPI0019D4127B|nr:hypothetical protein [Nonomuraea polychroma]